MVCAFSHLDEKKLQDIKSMEQKIGKTLLAFNCQAMKPAELNESQISELKNMEQKAGVILVAVET